jgi:hypothetical protein
MLNRAFSADGFLSRFLGFALGYHEPQLRGWSRALPICDLSSVIRGHVRLNHFGWIDNAVELLLGYHSPLPSLKRHTR